MKNNQMASSAQLHSIYTFEKYNKNEGGTGQNVKYKHGRRDTGQNVTYIYGG